MEQKSKVAIVMGSDSDFPIVKSTIELLKSFGVKVEVRVMSAHRSPNLVSEYVKTARERGIGVIIGAAGKAAHLPGVIAAYTTLPVIGLPIKSSTLDGLDSLLSIVQMPKGIPVATVAIDGGENAALLAIQILAIRNGRLAVKLEEHRQIMAEQVLSSDEKIQEEIGRRVNDNA